jgi:hypothetical protein
MPWIDNLPLFNSDSVAVPYASGSETSKAGAKAVKLKAGGQAQRVLDALTTPKTLHELAALTGLPLATICARVGWLRKIGRVEAVGAVMGPLKTPRTTYGRVRG